MQNDFPRYPGSREQLNAENKLMRRKLIERGARIGRSKIFNSEEGAEIENIILRNVLELDRQVDSGKKIKIYERIEKPTHFRPAASIPDHEISKALEELILYLNKYSLDLDVCSPSVTDRELYRFATEELFHLDIVDIRIDGLVACFIYDEFHPDVAYENGVVALEFCMRHILGKEPMKWMHRFRNDNLRLNDQGSLTVNEMRNKINAYKMNYDDLQIRKLEKVDCILTENKCVVKGTYAINAMEDREVYHVNGDWRIFFEPSSRCRYWDIVAVEIDGIRFDGL